MSESDRLTAGQVRDAVLENFEEMHETYYNHWEPSKFDWQAIADELNESSSRMCEFVDCGVCKFYHADIQLCEYGIPPCSKFERRAAER